jgi:hypothetical protein
MSMRAMRRSVILAAAILLSLTLTGPPAAQTWPEQD